MGCLRLTYNTNFDLVKNETTKELTPNKSDLKPRSNYFYGFNGYEADDEVAGEGNSYTTQFRQYDPRLGRWKSLDPKANEREWLSAYNFVQNNPLKRIDLTGGLDDEYDKDGNKISDLGGDEVDFHHQENGDVKIIDQNNNEESAITGGSEFIKNYKHRDEEVDYLNITGEFLYGVGPEKSLVTSGDMVRDIMESPIFAIAYEEFKESGKSKKRVAMKFGPTGVILSGTNMTSQMMGSAAFNFYKMGGNILVMVTDSKSISSWTLNPFDGEEVNKSRSKSSTLTFDNAEPKTTTHQTYLLYFNFNSE